MNKVFVADKNTGTGIFVAPNPKEAVEHLSDPNNLVWLDFYQPNFDWIRKRFDINKRLIDLSIEKTGMPHFEKIKQNCFVKLIALNPNKFGSVGDFAELNFILCQNMLVSIHDSPLDIFNCIENESNQIAKNLTRGIDSLFFYFVALLLKQNFVFAGKIQAELDFMECRLLNNETIKPDNKFFELKKTVWFYKKTIQAQMEILKEIQSIIKRDNNGIFKKSNFQSIKEITYKVKVLMFTFDKLIRVFQNISDTCKLVLEEKRLQKQNNFMLMASATIMLIMVSGIIFHAGSKYNHEIGLLVLACLITLATVYLKKPSA